MPRRSSEPATDFAFPTYLAAWRKHAQLTLEEVAQRLEAFDKVPSTAASLSRIEQGHMPYNQRLLEALAVIYGTDPAALISRDPSDSSIVDIWGSLDARGRRQIEAIAKAMISTQDDTGNAKAAG
jgi:transcriptional regulator with XRE-family HTH domain